MKNIKLILEYDGTNYHGFQIQPYAVTIQGVLEDCIYKITREKVKIIGCSRTDTGVHAAKYCASFMLCCSIPAERIADVMNNILPSDIRILSSEEVNEDFHPRFLTIAKTYVYTINTDKKAGVFTKNYEWQIREELDTALMQEGANHIIGEHDFRCFMTSNSDVKSTVRTVFSLDVKEQGSNVNIYIKADGYLYNMVRIITGTLVLVGLKKKKPEDILEIIKSKSRALAGPTAPPQGLKLYEIYY